ISRQKRRQRKHRKQHDKKLASVHLSNLSAKMQIRTALAHLCLLRQIGQTDRLPRKGLKKRDNPARRLCLAICRAAIGRQIAERAPTSSNRPHPTTSPNCPPFFGASLSPTNLRRRLGPPMTARTERSVGRKSSRRRRRRANGRSSALASRPRSRTSH